MVARNREVQAGPPERLKLHPTKHRDIGRRCPDNGREREPGLRGAALSAGDSWKQDAAFRTLPFPVSLDFHFVLLFSF